MKILTAEQMRVADQAMFSRIGVPSRAVMETAGREVSSLIVSLFPEYVEQGALVVCGGGNNGGDGLVIARTLLNFGLLVDVVLLKPLGELQGDAKANAEALLNSGGNIAVVGEGTWKDTESLAEIQKYGLLVDAIYGTGFSGPVRGFAADLIDYLNEVFAKEAIPIVSVDVPSGVESDTGKAVGAVIKASVTVALQCLKWGHVLFPGSENCGEIWLTDIGISQNLEELTGVNSKLLGEDAISSLLQSGFPFLPEEHKGVRGHVLVIGGGEGHYGAPKLSGEAALRSGSGLVSVVLPRSGAMMLAPSLNELMCIGLDSDSLGDFSTSGSSGLEKHLEGKQAIVLGPGIGQGDGARSVVEQTMKCSSKLNIPLVIDADALNLLAVDKNLRKCVGRNMLLTPHPGEMARLLRSTPSEIQQSRVEAVRSLVMELGCWVVLKGARSLVCGPEGELFVNPTAVSSLATAGSGDVLAGLIASFLGRGFALGDAAQAGVFVHGAAGEVAMSDSGGVVGVIASDIVEYFPVVINALLRMDDTSFEKSRCVLPGTYERLSEYFLEDA